MPSGIFSLKQQILATEVGAWSNQKPPVVDYLVVAGGGAGGGTYGSGGGAGGLLIGSTPVAVGSAITVTIGAGGAGVGNNNGNNGANSVFGNIVAVGGGYGVAGYGNQAGSGGSGGGSGGNSSGSRKWGQGVFGQGNRGGTATTGTGPAQAGGGGAGTVGVNGLGDRPAGDGGAGAASAISGSVTTYAGGGGGGTYNAGGSDYQGLGGPGGGGNAGNSNNSNAGFAGTANTGGGGGGASYSSGTGGTVAGGNGGSGIVIISYPDTYAAPASTTGSPTVSTSGSGSMLFNGSTQLLIFNSNSAFQFGVGEFTWETWVYINTSGDNGLFDLGSINSSGSFGVFIATNTIYVRIDGSSNDLTYSVPGGMPTSTWVHLAVVRSGTTLTLYYNGTSVASGTRINNVTQSTPYIGGLNGLSAYALKGQLSNTRVVKGSAVYTGNFTPSTRPLTAITNTSLLLNTVSGAYLADSSPNGFAPNTGTVAPTWSQLSPFATGLGYKNRVYTWTSSGSITF